MSDSGAIVKSSPPRSLPDGGTVSGDIVKSSPPRSLPDGWTVFYKYYSGRKVKCYIDPLTGRNFYSKPQVFEYLKTGKSTPRPKKMGVDSVSNPNMDELTGAITSLKLEEPQNVKTLKRTSGASKDKQMSFDNDKNSVEKVVIERVTPDGLPQGWIKEIKIQKTGNGTRKDPYYTDPVSGYVFRSQKDALRYLETGDINSCVIRPKKRGELRFLNEETYNNIGELTESRTTLKPEDSQNVHISNEQQMGSSKNNMGELTESGTTLKPEASQNVYISKEQQMGSSKVVIERVTPDGLPPGWIKEIVIQKKRRGTRKDLYYTDPVSGYAFRSQKEALRYVKTGDISWCAIRPKKRDELGFFGEKTSVSPDMGDLTEDQNSLTPQGTQNVKTQKPMSCASKEKQIKKSPGKPDMGDLTEDQTSLTPQGTQNAKTQKPMSCASKKKQIKKSAGKPDMGDLTEDQTSLTPQGTQNAKTQKPMSCATEEKQIKKSPGKVVIERVTPDGLRPGWIIKEIRIETKAHKTRRDPHYTVPVSEYVFGSQKDALRYLETGDINSCNSKPKKKSPGKVVIERGVTPDRLPPGWIKEIKIETKANGTRRDPYYTDPVSGYVFRSQNDALRYLETGDINSCSIKPKKRDKMGFLNEEISPNMGGLAEGQTSLIPEGSQNVKRFSRQSVRKVVIERLTPDGLPPGWIKEIKIQKKGNQTRRDPYYTDPVSGYVFRSQVDALRYVETGDINGCAIKPKKRDDLGFLNEETSPSSVAGMKKLGRRSARKLFAGTENSVKSSLETMNAEECSDMKGSYVPSNSPQQSKGSKRKRSKRACAENGTVSTPPTDILQVENLEENDMEKNNHKNTKINSSKSKILKARSLSFRSSRRLAGLKPEMATKGGLSEQAHGAAPIKPNVSEAKPSPGSLHKLAHSTPQQFQTVLETQIADYALSGTEAPSNFELSNGSKKPREDQAVPEEQQVKQETENKDEENVGSQPHPSGDSWSDPCLEFAFKTLTGTLPAVDNPAIQGYYPQQSLVYPSYASHARDGHLAVTEFGVPNFFQSDISSGFGAPGFGPPGFGPPGFGPPGFGAPGKPVSVPQLPLNLTLLPPGNIGLPSFGSAPQQSNLGGNNEHQFK